MPDALLLLAIFFSCGVIITFLFTRTNPQRKQHPVVNATRNAPWCTVDAFHGASEETLYAGLPNPISDMLRATPVDQLIRVYGRVASPF
jgi:hypothetical protein